MSRPAMSRNTKMVGGDRFVVKAEIFTDYILPLKGAVVS